MGCDYYIYKSLEIDFHYSINPVFIELSMERGYFYELNLDEDHPDYEEKYKECIREQLESHMDNILIYSDDNFVLPKYDRRYRDMIEEKLKKCKKEWKDIRKIMKVEHRSERD